MRFYEDIEVGETAESEGFQVSEDEIVAFAEKYDPQPMHLDPEAAADTMFGGLIASGWQTAAITMRLVVELQEDVPTLAGVGIDNLRWEAPLRPGDTLSIRTEVLDKRLSERHDDRGYVETRIRGVNQDDETIITYESTALIWCKDAE